MGLLLGCMFSLQVQAMDPEIKAEWVMRLRAYPELEEKDNPAALCWVVSGKCCALGILVEMARTAGIVTRERVPGRNFDYDTWRYTAVDDPSDWSQTGLPKAVARWASLPPDEPGVQIFGEPLTIYASRDHVYFASMADLIDCCLEMEPRVKILYDFEIEQESDGLTP